LRENTLILYTSDHGFSLGNHGIWGHGLAAWPSSIKKPSFNIPLIFSGPNISNEHSNALVSQLDIGNTILNYVGLDPIKTTYNDSQIIDLKKNNSSFRKALFMEQEETRAIRTEDWLYMERINNQEMPFLNPELYDLRNDPLEYKNLSEEIKYKSIIETLSKKLHDYFKSHSNPKFDLWNGGKAKSNVSSEAFWKKIWGEDWSCTY
jgi:arylsulfatase A-like enzyme